VTVAARETPSGVLLDGSADAYRVGPDDGVSVRGLR
jgi:hypothetical protein